MAHDLTFLEDMDRRFDPNSMLLESTVPPGEYHCRLPAESIVHSPRESLIYAIELLDSGRRGVRELAASVIERAISFQDTDPTSPTYGIWPLYAEEPLGTLTRPDWNFADFVGSQLAYLYDQHGRDLDRAASGIAEKIRTAMTHAAWSIFRRNVDPRYTNIAFSGAAVCAHVGELISERLLIDFARRRLETTEQLRAQDGGFSEYNSPGYAQSSIRWCERMLGFVEDAEVRTRAGRLLRTLWCDYAESFYPATAQLAGPHSRAYAPWLRAPEVQFINERTGLSLPVCNRTSPPKDRKGNDIWTFVKPVPCPKDLVPRFRSLPREKLLLTHSYRVNNHGKTVRGTTWLNGSLSFGTADEECAWVQRHAFIAYWRSDAEPAAMLRARVLRDGVDFASGRISTTQKRNAALTIFGLYTNRGDWHLYLDAPENPGIFEASSLCIRYELAGNGVTATTLDPGRFELACGSYRAVVHTGPGRFGRRQMTWRIGNGEIGTAPCRYVEGIWYEGTQRVWDFNTLRQVYAIAGVEILPARTIPKTERPTIEASDDLVRARWNWLSIEAPDHPSRA